MNVMSTMIQPKSSAMLALQDLTQVIVVKMCTDKTLLSILLANVKVKVSEIVMHSTMLCYSRDSVA